MKCGRPEAPAVLQGSGLLRSELSIRSCMCSLFNPGVLTVGARCAASAAALPARSIQPACSPLVGAYFLRQASISSFVLRVLPCIDAP